MSDGRSHPRTIEAFRLGDREAFRSLFEEHKDRVYSIALHFLKGDESSARDVSQQVFLDLYARIGQFRGESSFSTWLYRIVANACMDEHRRRRRFTLFGGTHEADTIVAEPITAGEQSGDWLVVKEAALAVQSAVRKLTPKLRLAVLMKHFEEMSYEEIAGALGCSAGTVASRLNRAHVILARRLAHLRPASPGGGRFRAEVGERTEEK